MAVRLSHRVVRWVKITRLEIKVHFLLKPGFHIVVSVVWKKIHTTDTTSRTTAQYDRNDRCNLLLVNNQHGFRKKLSCETQLICTVEEIARSLDKGEETDLIIMDFSKAFDSVPHQRLLVKLRYYSIRGTLNTWLTQWLTCRSQSVVGYNSALYYY